MTSNDHIQPKARILVVEDEAVAALSLQRGLRMSGYEVCGLTATGEEAVVMALQCKPDVILMDVLLAGENNGFEAARRIRSRADTPFVFLTGYADKWIEEQMQSLGENAYLLKPFGPEDVLEAVHAALARKKGEFEPI